MSSFIISSDCAFKHINNCVNHWEIQHINKLRGAQHALGNKQKMLCEGTIKLDMKMNSIPAKEKKKTFFSDSVSVTLQSL